MPNCTEGIGCHSGGVKSDRAGGVITGDIGAGDGVGVGVGTGVGIGVGSVSIAGGNSISSDKGITNICPMQIMPGLTMSS